MMKFLFLVLAFALVSDHAFSIDKISGPTKADSCAIRISNQPVSSNEPLWGTEFCSGSVIENGSMIAFAAHCLNQILENKSDVLGDNSFEIGFPGLDDSEKIKLKTHQYSLFSGDLLSSVASRQAFLESGNPTYIQDDLAIINLKKPISNMTNCPVLPSPSECDEFEKDVLSLSNGVGLYVDFFISNEIVQPGSVIRKVVSRYPSKKVIQVRASDFEFFPSNPEVKNLQAPIKASFVESETEVRMRKGDSGSLAYWKQNSKNIFIGVQSATITGAPNKAYFSQICKHVGTKKYEEFLR